MHPYVLNVYKEALNYGSLGSFINKGNVKFIPKLGDPEVVTNWKAITLLNMSYKIIAKVALALKLRSSLALIIRSEKNRSIQSRYILDNILDV